MCATVISEFIVVIHLRNFDSLLSRLLSFRFVVVFLSCLYFGVGAILNFTPLSNARNHIHVNSTQCIYTRCTVFLYLSFSLSLSFSTFHDCKWLFQKFLFLLVTNSQRKISNWKFTEYYTFLRMSFCFWFCLYFFFDFVESLRHCGILINQNIRIDNNNNNQKSHHKM